MSIPGGWELLLVVAVIMVLFGYKRLPDATRSLGQSMRIFKAEAKGLRDDDPAARTGTGGSTAVTPPAVSAPSAAASPYPGTPAAQRAEPPASAPAQPAHPTAQTPPPPA